MGSGIFASGPADPFLNLHYLHSLLPKQVSHQLWCICLIFCSYKLHAHHKTHCIYPRSWSCVSMQKHSSQTGHRLSSVKNSRGSSRVTPFTLLQTARRNQNCQTQASCASVEITTQKSTWIKCKFAL